MLSEAIFIAVQSYPAKPVYIIVPSPSTDGADLMACAIGGKGQC